jgi:hypothetical protein
MCSGEKVCGERGCGEREWLRDLHDIQELVVHVWLIGESNLLQGRGVLQKQCGEARRWAR